MTEGHLTSYQEASHAPGVQGADFQPELPDRGREEQTEEAEVKPVPESGGGGGWARF